VNIQATVAIQCGLRWSCEYTGNCRDTSGDCGGHLNKQVPDANQCGLRWSCQYTGHCRDKSVDCGGHVDIQAAVAIRVWTAVVMSIYRPHRSHLTHTCSRNYNCSGPPSFPTIFCFKYVLFSYFFLFVSTICFGPYGPSSSVIYTSQSLEAIMPTTDPLFLLGYTIII
jgi:hypothetical protein